LDRLLAIRQGSQPNNAADANLNRLFTLAQSLPDFNSSKFATELNQFAKSLSQ
jgi:flagellar hook-associated protein FlgK